VNFVCPDLLAVNPDGSEAHRLPFNPFQAAGAIAAAGDDVYFLGGNRLGRVSRSDVSNDDPTGILTRFATIVDTFPISAPSISGFSVDAVPSGTLLYVISNNSMLYLWSCALDGSNQTQIAGPMPLALAVPYSGTFHLDHEANIASLLSTAGEIWSQTSIAVAYNWRRTRPRC